MQCEICNATIPDLTAAHARDGRILCANCDKPARKRSVITILLILAIVGGLGTLGYGMSQSNEDLGGLGIIIAGAALAALVVWSILRKFSKQ